MISPDLKKWLENGCDPDELDILITHLDKGLSDAISEIIPILEPQILENVIYSLPQAVTGNVECNLLVKTLDEVTGDELPAIRRILIGQLILEILIRGERWAECIPRIDSLLALAVVEHLEEEECILLNYGGVCRYRLQKYPEAKEALERSLELAERLDNNRRRSRARINLGLVHKEMGRLEEAAAHYKVALKLSRDNDDKRTLLSCYLNIGNIYRELSRWDEGRKALELGKNLARELSNETEECRAILNLGVLFLDEGMNLELAANYFEHVIEYSEVIGAAQLGAIALSNLALVKVRLGDSEMAAELSQKSMELARNAGDIELGWRAKANLARANISQGNFKQADQLFLETLGDFDYLIGTLKNDRDRTEFQRNLQIMLAEYVEFAIESLGIEAAFGRLSIAKGRALRRTSSPFSKGAGAKSGDDPDLIYEKILKAISEREGMVLVDYFISGNKVTIFTLTADGVSVAESGSTLSEINTLLAEFSSEINLFIASREYRENCYLKDFDIPEVLKKLSKALLDPVKEKIWGASRIFFVPAGPLFGIPFSALTLDGMKYLIESMVVSVLPSSDHFPMSGYIPIENPGIMVLTGLMTDLNSADSEISALRDIFGENFRLTDIREFSGLSGVDVKISGIDAVHFVGHAEFDLSDPFSSALIMSDGSRLEVLTLLDGHLNLRGVSLVTLSACETGTGKVMSGDELVGISRGFIASGARCVVSSLWKVSDRATSDLMCKFYRYWAGGYSPAESLREASLSMLKTRRYHPYFFAPFIVMCE